MIKIGNSYVDIYIIHGLILKLLNILTYLKFVTKYQTMMILHEK